MSAAIGHETPALDSPYSTCTDPRTGVKVHSIAEVHCPADMEPPGPLQFWCWVCTKTLTRGGPPRGGQSATARPAAVLGVPTDNDPRRSAGVGNPLLLGPLQCWVCPKTTTRGVLGVPQNNDPRRSAGVGNSPLLGPLQCWVCPKTTTRGGPQGWATPRCWPAAVLGVPQNNDPRRSADPPLAPPPRCSAGCAPKQRPAEVRRGGQPPAARPAAVLGVPTDNDPRSAGCAPKQRPAEVRRSPASPPPRCSAGCAHGQQPAEVRRSPASPHPATPTALYRPAAAPAGPLLLVVLLLCTAPTGLLALSFWSPPRGFLKATAEHAASFLDFIKTYDLATIPPATRQEAKTRTLRAKIRAAFGQADTDSESLSPFFRSVTPHRAAHNNLSPLFYSPLSTPSSLALTDQTPFPEPTVQTNPASDPFTSEPPTTDQGVEFRLPPLSPTTPETSDSPSPSYSPSPSPLPKPTLSIMAQPPIIVKPMPARGQSSAPTFVPERARELRRYFSDLNHLFIECNVVDEQEKKTHTTRYTDIDTADLWEQLDEFAVGTTHDEWQKAIMALYSGASKERKYSMADLDYLIRERHRLGIQSNSDLGEYYRQFLSVTQFLVSENRLSVNERDRQFRRAFQSDLWSKIHRRLEILNPNHHPDDPYATETVCAAAEHILHGTNAVQRQEAPPGAPPQVTITPSGSLTGATRSPSTGQPLKLEELYERINLLEQHIQRLGQDKGGDGGRPNQSTNDNCHFCGGEGHYIPNCPVHQAYATEGRCRRTDDNKIGLPSGARIPAGTPGRYIKDKLDEWHRRNPGQMATGQLSADANPTESMMLEILQFNDITDHDLKIEDRMIVLERELNTLRARKEVFDGVELISRAPQKRPVTIETVPDADQPRIAPSNKSAPASQPVSDAAIGKAKAPPPPSNIPLTPSTKTDATGNARDQTPVHPFSNIPENRYVPPTTRNLAATEKAKADSAYRTQAPITDPTKSTTLFERALDATIPITGS
ncbi:hypothetical protein D9615_010562 [Tricholomella constricta]|uniref:CCHC-type domain-containing protein n=1 Tax=Tricholomella constricta TaxID=117010 RepID=A0A8H5LRY2_9AGAR|nr:hypothetical protein D9615_010562 [Tricholomella constricta]